MRSSGRKEDALREGQRAMELKPITHDVIEGAVVEDFYTLTCARLGETDEGDQPNRAPPHHAVRGGLCR